MKVLGKLGLDADRLSVNDEQARHLRIADRRSSTFTEAVREVAQTCREMRAIASPR
jgi:hypothetical protein